ncbi:MAG: ornithine carbamoyltransferase [Aigarchaeota archaeon]|nr:ornithine carbamoyltransferase [Aigarchaeota archaeon]MCS7117238.1 ornithine carbamoyltransferase [Candidatus Calditenuaceae archaeon]MDW8041239.1 ornithine carbamoyltransferase [Nitrososphaerota archaeon]
MSRHYLEVLDLSRAEFIEAVRTAVRFKSAGYPPDGLRGRTIAMVFEKPSTRTRVSFTSAIRRLGGSYDYLASTELQLARGEPVSDVGRVLSRYVDGLVCRVYSHSTLETLAANSSVPVINALSDRHHPCQALADLMTVFEVKKTFSGIKVAFIGDGNNVATSLMQACALTGVDFAIASPRGFWVPEEETKKALEAAQQSGAEVTLTDDPEEAVRGADFVYTDVFVSMGFEAEREQRLKAFLPLYRVTRELLSHAKPDAKFMHCMPVKRGEEVEAEVADGPRSVMYDQAENRMHTEASLLYLIYRRWRWL